MKKYLLLLLSAFSRLGSLDATEPNLNVLIFTKTGLINHFAHDKYRK